MPKMGSYVALMMKFLSPPSVPVHVPLLNNVKGNYFQKILFHAGMDLKSVFKLGSGESTRSLSQCENEYIISIVTTDLE